MLVIAGQFDKEKALALVEKYFGAIPRPMRKLDKTYTDEPPQEIILDYDATDDPTHGNQDQRYFNGFYDGYCFLPLYVFCGRHLRSISQSISSID